jgi:5'-nucleotidase
MNNQPLKILISNDDGIFALGVRSLANTLSEAGHQVTVVCPDQERSATGHGLTLHHPIRAEVINSIFDPQVTAWSCSGTPSDCVKFALSAVLDDLPDLVLAGINHGANLGTDILYSGTVSAAMEGLLEGIPSIAFSLNSFVAKDFSVAAAIALDLVNQLSKLPISPVLLNVNIPYLPKAEIKGMMITPLGVRRYTETFQKRFDPRGRSYYWLAGEIVEELEQPRLPSPSLTDVQAIQKKYITITPLQYNLTDFANLNSWSNESPFKLII